MHRPVVHALAVLAVLHLAVAPQARAQPPAAARVFSGAPAASWIAPPGVPPDSFVVFHARRAFELAERPARFLVHVSADNRYRLYVNGEQVSAGPQRSDVDHWRYETVDLAPRLRAGRNVIAALVWNWGGRMRPVAQHAWRTGFLLQGDGAAEATLVNTGAGWRLRDRFRVRSAPTGARADQRLLRVAAGRRDRRRAPAVGMGTARLLATTTGSSYRPAQSPATVGRLRLRALPGSAGTGVVSGWQLQPRDLPPMEETVQRIPRVRRASGVAASDGFLRGAGDLVVPPRTKATLLLDQGHTTNAYPVLETSGGAGSTVTLTYAEALVDARGQKGHRDSVEGRTLRGLRDQIRPAGERRRFQTLWWRSYRYVQLDVETADEPLRVHDLHGIFTAYPFQQRGRFASDQRWIDSVWTMNWNGARIGAFETYMDTPYYEQLQYVGDTRIQGLISLYVSRRRPAPAAGDPALRRLAAPRRDHGEPLSVGARPAHRAVLAHPRRHGARLPHASRRSGVRSPHAAGRAHGPRLVWAARGLDGDGRPDALLELPRLGARLAARRGAWRGRRPLDGDRAALRVRPSPRRRVGGRTSAPPGWARPIVRARTRSCGRRARTRGTRRAGSSAIARRRTARTPRRSASRRTCSPFSPTPFPRRSAAR